MIQTTACGNGGHEGVNAEDPWSPGYSGTLSTGGSERCECPCHKYRELIRAMIANDEACPAFTCDITMLGHVLAGLPDRLIKLVQELDDTDGRVRRG